MAAIAFIGLGNMGGPMAGNLIRGGHAVTGHDTDAAAVERFALADGAGAGSIADCVRDAEIVITMLPAGRQAEAVYAGEGGVFAHARAGALLIDCSTIDVATSRSLGERGALAGFMMCDAPVSGGVAGAAAGTLTFMVGGGDEAFARARPVLQAMGRTIVHAGASGSGQAAKICNNMILGVSMIAVSEAFALAERLGLDAQKLFDVASTSSGQCWSLTSYCPVPGPVPTSPANRDYQPGFTAAMMLKDLKLAHEAASLSGAAVPLGAEAAALYSLYCNSGASGSDFSGIYRFIRGETGDKDEKIVSPPLSPH